MYTFLEFFAGGGMARAGLGQQWSCLLANDIDPKKGTSYLENWGGGSLQIGDVADLDPETMPSSADLAWASFPCQDLSLAGNGAGLDGARSGTFWPFWNLMKALGKRGHAPTLIVLENVCGALSSHDGKDFTAIAEAIARSGYRFGALVIDAVRFVPQSRPRLFIVAARANRPLPRELVSEEPQAEWHTGALTAAFQRLPPPLRQSWIWWRLPAPPARNIALADMVEDEPRGVRWNSATETRRLLGMMSPLNLSKVAEAKKSRNRTVGTIYKRTRSDRDGVRTQRAEVRFDGIAGCLRTPVGGSSRQTIVIVDGNRVRSRLLSPREAARLMGLPDEYRLPDNYNQAYHLAGDGVAVPVVRHIAQNILEPLLANDCAAGREAA